MKRLLTIIIAGLLSAALAVPALAKGPASATITGPGIDEPIVLDGDPHPDSGSQLAEFSLATGFWKLAYGADIDGRGLNIFEVAPTRELGPEYVVVWSHGGAGGDVTSLVYPHAAGGPLVFVEPAVYITDMNMETHGGWFVSTDDVGGLLGRYGASLTKTEPTAPLQQVVPEPELAASPELTPIPAPADPGPVVGWVWLVPAGLVFTVGIWAMGRRSRRLTTS